MEKNKLNISLFLAIVTTVFLTAILSMPSISAGVTINSPLSSGKLYGNSESTVNVTVTTDFKGVFNCTVYGGSSLTANTNWTTVYNGTGTVNQSATVWNATFNIRGVLEDANDYTINLTCSSGTAAGSYNGSTVTSITIDNGVPMAPTSLYPTETVTNQSFTVGATVTDANTTSCTLFFDGTNPGAASYAGTYSTSSCTYSITNIPEQTYKYYFQASDETNTTNSAVSTMTIGVRSKKIPAIIEGPGVVSKGATLSIVDTAKDTLTSKVGGIPIWLIIAGVIVIVAIVIYKRK